MNIQGEKFDTYTVAPRAVTPALSIGAVLVDSGKITQQDAERVMRLQREQGLRFGDAAVKLRLITEAELEQVLSRQYEFPFLIPGESKLSRELVAAYSPFDPRVEVFRALRSQLMLRWFNPELELKHLAIVSPYRGEGRTYLAANMAVVFSQLGQRTLLIDADMRKPRQHMLFHLQNRAGLSTVLAGRADVGAIEKITPLQGLSVLPAGPIPPNPQELLSRPAFRTLLAQLDKDYDIIILDTPAAEGSADAQSIASRDCGALIVARRNRTPVSAVKTLFEHLTSTSATLVGAVINTA
jgi:protein-tyrosine kinase